MKQNFRRLIGLFLLIVMLLNVTAFTDTRAYGAANPAKVNEAISKFADAAAKISSNISETQNMVSDFFTRFGGGGTAALAGVIGILQMTGVIKDPTTEMLKEIIEMLHDIQETLAKMDKKLDDIIETLLDIRVDQKIIDRATKGRDMSKNWNDFNTNYIEPLNRLMREYDAKIVDSMEAWWKQAHTEGVRVLVMTYTATEVSQTYTLKPYSDGFPTKADNGDEVNMNWSIGIPAEYIPNTSAMTFNVNTYREDFKKAMVERLKAAIKDGKIEGGPAFVGNAANNSKLLEQYADYVLNAVIYDKAC